MASIVERGDSLHVVFRFGGRRFSRSLKTSVRRQAEGALARLIENLSLVERGRLIVPMGADVPTFLLSDGKLNEPPKAKATLTLTNLFTQYFAMLPPGNLEQSTIDGMRSHERQLCNILGKRFRVRELRLLDLQRFVEVRSQGRGVRGRPTSAATIKKAIVTLRTVWNWALLAGLVEGPFPSKGLRYPKLVEKPPFQTFSDVEARVARGGLTAAEEGDLWESVFLTIAEIDELLEYVWGAAERNVAYPMFVFAAHKETFITQLTELMQKEVRDAHGQPVPVFVNQPRRHIRAVPANAHDQIYCERLGALAVDNALAGYTDFMISNWLTEFVLVPLHLVHEGQKSIPVNGMFWKQVVSSTGQPLSRAEHAARAAASERPPARPDNPPEGAVKGQRPNRRRKRPSSAAKKKR